MEIRQTLLLSGKMLTGRDAAQCGTTEMMAAGKQLPVDLTNRFILLRWPR